MGKAGEPGLWIGLAGDLAIKVAKSIKFKNQFTTTVTTSEINPKAAELAVAHLAIDEYDDQELGDFRGCYIGICQAGREVATGQSTIMVSNLVHVPSVTVEAIKEALPPRFGKMFSPPLSDIYRPSPRLWGELLL